MQKILAIDDNQDNLEMLKALLEKFLPDTVAFTAQSGQHGIEVAKRDLPDVIFLDIVMPEMDGYEVCSRLKTDKATQHIPVIMLTAIDTDTQSRIKALNLGAEAFLTKPIEATELVAQLKVMLRIKRAEDRLRREKELLAELVQERTKALQDELNERKRMEKALRESEKKYRTLFENMAQGAFYQRADGVLVDGNSAVLEMFGLTRDQFLGRTSMDPRWKVIHEDGSDFPGEQHPSMEALRTGKPVRGVVAGVFNPRKKDYVWLSINAIPQFKAGEDKPYQVFVTLHDITERKRAEEALIHEQELMRALMDNIPDTIYFKDADSRFIRINRAKANRHGLNDPAEAVGKTDFDFFAEEHARQAFLDEQKIITSGQPLVGKEEKLTWPDGRKTWVSATKVPLRDKEGHIIGTFGISRDITARKQAEEALKKSEQKFRSVVEQSSDGIILTDDQGMIIEWNPGAEQITGIKRTEALRQAIWDIQFQITPKEQRTQTVYEQLKTMIHKFLKTRQVSCLNQLRETNIQRPDGATRTVQYGAFPIQTEHSFMVGSIIRDITEHQRAEEALKESESKLKSILSSIDDLVFVFDKEGRFIFYYPCSTSKPYRPPEEFLGKKHSEVMPPFIDELFTNAFRKNKKGEVAEYEYWLEIGGKKEWWFAKLSPVVLKSEFAGSVAVIRNITERKQAEEALRTSERQYRLLVEHVADGIGIIREDRFVFVNDALASMFGDPGENLIGKTPVELFHEDYKPSFEKLATQLEHQIPELPGHGLEFAVTKDDRERWMEGRYSAIMWAGQPALLMTVRDITAKKIRQMAVEQEREYLRREIITLRSTMKDRYKFGEIIGKSPLMQEIYALILKAAASEENVVIYGESGTGKELVAQTIHQFSNRCDRAFVPVNCSAIPDNLFESELFGYRKGAFTGADRDKVGLFDLAHSGTLFLDEIGQLNPFMQAKLLRVLEDGSYLPVGGNRIQHADVRIIAATNQDLKAQFKQGLLREDFFYRIHVIVVNLPPLRDRKEDIPLLIDHFLKLYSTGKKKRMLPGTVLDRLYEYNWPGNIREFENVLHRYLAIGQLDFSDIHEAEPGTRDDLARADREQKEIAGLGETLAQAEKHLIIKTLDHYAWHRSKTAAALGIPRRSLYRKMKKYGLI